MSNKYPNRGPRVMTGMAKMLAQARALPTFDGIARDARQTVLTPVPAKPAATSEDLRMAGETVEAMKQLRIATHALGNVRHCITAFRKQCDNLPDGDMVRGVIERMLKTFEDSIAAAEREA